MKTRIVLFASTSLLCLLAIFAIGCMPGPKITDEIVLKYIKAYTGLRKMGPELADRIKNAQGKDPDIDPGMAGYGEIERIIKEAGFNSYREFVEVNAKIGLAFSQIEGRGFMDKMDKMHQIGYEEIDKQLADPEVPEEVKAQLRKTKADLIANMEKNKPWAEGVMKGAELMGDKETMEVVRRHADEIRSAYTGGIQQPQTEFFGRKL